MQETVTEMMEYICDDLCRHPREIKDQEELDRNCADCSMGDYVWEFLVKYWPENPNELMAEGIEVPLIYLANWMCTYGCNNWKKLHNMPMWRKKLQFKQN